MRAMKQLVTNYRGANLTIELDQNECRLLINGLVREQRELASAITLSSTVQTDYEWHEFIQGTITRSDDSLTMVLSANNVEIARQDFSVP
tara:strand:+ start:984 stop:1253 length:270 start_codon:yes stop_codon:yes gene_type:complete